MCPVHAWRHHTYTQPHKHTHTHTYTHTHTHAPVPTPTPAPTAFNVQGDLQSLALGGGASSLRGNTAAAGDGGGVYVQRRLEALAVGEGAAMEGNSAGVNGGVSCTALRVCEETREMEVQNVHVVAHVCVCVCKLPYGCAVRCRVVSAAAGGACACPALRAHAPVPT